MVGNAAIRGLGLRMAVLFFGVGVGADAHSILAVLGGLAGLIVGGVLRIIRYNVINMLRAG